MIGELDLYGVFIPPLLVCLILALLVSPLCRRALASVGFYRFVWHPALFNLALFVLVLGGMVALTTSWTSP